MSERTIDQIRYETTARGKIFVAESTHFRSDTKIPFLKAGEILTPDHFSRLAGYDDVQALDVVRFDVQPTNEDLKKVIEESEERLVKAVQESTNKKVAGAFSAYRIPAQKFNLLSLVEIVHRSLQSEAPKLLDSQSGKKGKTKAENLIAVQTVNDWVNTFYKSSLDDRLESNMLAMVREKIKQKRALVVEGKGFDETNDVLDLLKRYTGEESVTGRVPNFDQQWFCESVDQAVLTILMEKAREKKARKTKEDYKDLKNVPYFILAQLFHNLVYSVGNLDFAHMINHRVNSYLHLYADKYKGLAVDDPQRKIIEEKGIVLKKLSDSRIFEGFLKLNQKIADLYIERNIVQSQLKGYERRTNPNESRVAELKGELDEKEAGIRAIKAKYDKIDVAMTKLRDGQLLGYEAFEDVISDFHTDLSYLLANAAIPERTEAFGNDKYARDYVLLGIRFGHGQVDEMLFIDEHSADKKLEIPESYSSVMKEMKEGEAYQITTREVELKRKTGKIPKAVERIALTNELYDRFRRMPLERDLIADLIEGVREYDTAKQQYENSLADYDALPAKIKAGLEHFEKKLGLERLVRVLGEKLPSLGNKGLRDKLYKAVKSMAMRRIVSQKEKDLDANFSRTKILSYKSLFETLYAKWEKKELDGLDAIVDELNGKDVLAMEYDGERLFMAVEELRLGNQVEALIKLVKEYHKTGEPRKIASGRVRSPYTGISAAEYKKALGAFSQKKADTGYVNETLTEQVNYFLELKRSFESVHKLYSEMATFIRENSTDAAKLISNRDKYLNGHMVKEIDAMLQLGIYALEDEGRAIKAYRGRFNTGFNKRRKNIPAFRKKALDWFMRVVVSEEYGHEKLDDFMDSVIRERIKYQTLYDLSVKRTSASKMRSVS
jgi:hypothetical protein